MGIDTVATLTVLLAALLLDLLYGEYPHAVHPVVWIGKTISALLRLAPAKGPVRQLVFGTLLAVLITALCVLVCQLVPMPRRGALGLTYFFLGPYLLKASFALRELRAAAFRVLFQLEKGDLTSAREALRSLCSRDPSELSAEELAAATLESLAENVSDSFVAPLFYFALHGIPWAMGYRAINTLDAMVGYHGRFEWLGKVPAWLDDLANWIPARLTALLLLLAACVLGGDARRGWRVMWRDAGKTPSPNGGWPMAAMAGLLGVRLEKKDVYVLGDAREPLTPEKVRQAWRIVAGAAGLAVVLCVAGVVLLH